MKERQIKLNFDAAREFVKVSSQCEFDINLFYRHIMIDAKSLLGVLAMDFNNTLTVQYGGEDQRFENMIRKYAVA